MRISGTTGAVVALMALAAVGGGTFFFKTIQNNKKLELEKQIQDAKLKIRMADAKAKEEEARGKAADAKKAEAERQKAEADAEAEQTKLAVKNKESSNLKDREAVAKAEEDRAIAVKAAADAETKKAEAVKIASEAKIREQEKRAAAEAIARERALSEQKKAEAALNEKLAAKKIADAALEKSENERKTAEANAAAEHDRKLRLYSRANTSRAELLALKRAEKLLELEERGALDADDEDNVAGADAEASALNGEGADATNAVVNVKWPNASSGTTPAGQSLAAKRRELDNRITLEQERMARKHIDKFGALAAGAEAEGRAVDADYYRRTLITFVPDYVNVYEKLIDESRKAGDVKSATQRITELIAIVPAWQRVAVLVQLLKRDEAYYSRELAGRVGRDEYVKAFRKIYEEARRDKGDRDERDAKIEHICKVLATYVPDFETSPEWK